MSHNAHVLCFSRGSAHRIKTVAPRTDNEMDTEAAAYARTELALQSKERRKQEAAELNERQPGRPRKDKHASAKYVVATSV